jgi:hypothetical protein
MVALLCCKSVHPQAAKLASFVALERIHCHIDEMCVDFSRLSLRTRVRRWILSVALVLRTSVELQVRAMLNQDNDTGRRRRRSDTNALIEIVRKKRVSKNEGACRGTYYVDFIIKDIVSS